MTGHPIPDDIRAALTDDQITRLSALMTPPSAAGTHTIAYRVSTWLFGQRIYVALLTGLEARSPGRVRRDGQNMSGLAFLLRVVLVCGWITLAAATLALAGVVTLYLAKSFAGIDLMEGPSLFHGWFF
jgi:hypothetical protein